MKKLLALVALVTSMSFAHGKEIFTIVSTTSPSHSGSPSMLALVEEANRIQNKYDFIVEFKSGGLETIGLRYMQEKPQNRAGVVYPGFIDTTESGMINGDDFVPLFSQGDSCWVLISNVGDQSKGVSSLEQYRGQELTVGGTGFGNAAHLTTLMLAEKYGFKVRYIVYRSNFEALVQTTADNQINFMLERVKNFNQFKPKNDRLQMLGASCPTRHPDAPTVKTLREQGFDTPFVFQFIMVDRRMDADRRNEIESIFEKATKNLGQGRFTELSDLIQPILRGVKSEQHINSSFTKVRKLRERFKQQIESSK